ncbi:4'-phosphopantetheinyl transferase family protein [Streptomyces sp. NPDC006602]|uniref:4'-phosphopantetheinyl transferase family protein n=1 Tax=Streptomyces sp. NPDC006602 TaxID=3364751 RepID=UPI0036BD45A6
MAWGSVADWLPAGWDGRTPPPGLDPADRRRLAVLRHPLVRDRLLASRLLAKEVAAAALGTPPARITLAGEPGGRPTLAGRPGVGISLSHTAGLVLVGLCHGGRIGVDAERADRRLPAADTLCRHHCSPEERAWLASLPDAEREGELVRLWTLKEAYAKAVGLGMSLDFATHGFLPRRPAAGRSGSAPYGLVAAAGHTGVQSSGQQDARDGNAVGENTRNERWSFACHIVEGPYALAVARSHGRAA